MVERCDFNGGGRRETWSSKEGYVGEIVGCSCRGDGGVELGRKVTFGGGTTGSYRFGELLCGRYRIACCRIN